MRNIALERRGVAPMERPGEPVAAHPAHSGQPRAHICFLAPHAWPVLSGDPTIAEVGGAEVQQSMLARLLAADGYRVSMICLDYGQPDRALVNGVTVYKSFRASAGAPVLRFFHPRLTATWRALRAAGADVYYCRSASMWVSVVAEFCRRHGKRCVYAGASNMDFVPGEGGQIRYARDRWLYRRGLARVDRIVAQNEAQRESCRAAYGREATVIASCYQPASPVRAGAPRDAVLWVSTVREGKRPERFLELAARLPHRRFVMVGGPCGGQEELFERVRRQAARLGNVELTGFLPLAQVEAWLDRARVLVNTSDYEGMPNTFLQAWSRGVPTLATVDVEAAVHRRFAGIEDGAGKIEALFVDADLWRSVSRHCLEHFRRTHSPAHALEQYGRLVAELLA
jgi:glycosyltransferase involved in cell wall biosynthesis